MPKKPKLMFQICQKLRRGLTLVLVMGVGAAVGAAIGKGEKSEGCGPQIVGARSLQIYLFAYVFRQGYRDFISKI